MSESQLFGLALQVEHPLVGLAFRYERPDEADILNNRCKAILENMIGKDLAVKLPTATVDPAIPQKGLKWDTVDARNGDIM